MFIGFSFEIDLAGMAEEMRFRPVI